MKRFGLSVVGFIGGAIGGWMVAIGLYIVWFEVSGDVDRDGGAAMGVAFFFGPVLGLITGLIAAIMTYRATKPAG